MASIAFDPQPHEAYAALEKGVGERLLDAIAAALDRLEADPGDAAVRRRSFRDGLWGIPVRDRTEDGLIIWEYYTHEQDMVVVHYLGPDPFA
ncbi:MAG: hypothetical protein L0Y54_16525 [Sporichthyaceae bacterium]|nr:hypothetical protein [Sporichthyaceae bacterium]